MANILIVDDDSDLGDVLREVLTDLGHEVRVARDGCEGLAALNDGYPDVVVLDVEMPVLDGPGMAHQMLIEDAGKERIPIVLISGYVDLRAIAARVGTPYVAPKPCPLDTFLGLLERALAEQIPPAPRSSTGEAPRVPGP